MAFGPDATVYWFRGWRSGGDLKAMDKPGHSLRQILRIDVKDLDAAGNYKIPSDNPFVNAAAPERDMGLWTAKPMAVLLR